MHFALGQGDGRCDDMIGMARWRIVKCTIYGDDKRNDTLWFPTTYLNTEPSFLIRLCLFLRAFLFVLGTSYLVALKRAHIYNRLLPRVGSMMTLWSNGSGPPWIRVPVDIRSQNLSKVGWACISLMDLEAAGRVGRLGCGFT